jgi:hypothetical protein
VPRPTTSDRAASRQAPRTSGSATARRSQANPTQQGAADDEDEADEQGEEARRRHPSLGPERAGGDQRNDRRADERGERRVRAEDEHARRSDQGVRHQGRDAGIEAVSGGSPAAAA